MKFAIWDIDNCIADDGPRIPLIDWGSTDPRLRYENYHSACMGDRPGNLHIFLRVSKTFAPLFITGRPESVRSQTQLWLAQHLPGFDEAPLLMRPIGCELSSVELKRDLLATFNSQNKLSVGDIAMAFDDHEGIVEMYVSHFGIPAQVLKIHDLNAYKGEHELVRGDGGHQAYLDRLEDAGAAPIEELGPVQGARPSDSADAFGYMVGGGIEMRIARNLPPRSQPPRRVTAADRLDAMAQTFRERNGVYRDNFRKVPEMVKVLFGEDGPPSSLVLRPEWHLFELMLVKLTRFTQTELTHADSIHDIAIYGAMIDAILTERQQAATNERATPQ